MYWQQTCTKGHRPWGQSGLIMHLKTCLKFPAQFFQPLLEKHIPPKKRSCSDPSGGFLG